jgi:hypothetical protein
MVVNEKVVEIIERRAPLAICFKCMARQAHVSATTAGKTTRDLLPSGSIERAEAICSWCGEERLCARSIQ